MPMVKRWSSDEKLTVFMLLNGLILWVEALFFL